MRIGLIILLPALLAACKDRPDFDTRYDQAAKEIEARARAMDADIAESAPPGLPARDKPSNEPPSSGE